LDREVPHRSAFARTLRPAIPPRAVAITVDDGHRSVYAKMFPIILRYEVPVTLFVYPIPSRSPPIPSPGKILGEMVRSGLVDVQFHTLSHPDFRHEQARRSPADYAAFVHFELTMAGIDRTRLGVNVEMLAWPYGIYDAELERAAAQAGFTAAFAVKNNSPSESSIFAVPRLSIGSRDPIERFASRLNAPSSS